MPKYFQSLAMGGGILALVYFSALYFVPEIFVIINRVFLLMIPFIFAALVALLIEPAVSFLSGRTRLNRGGAVAFSLFGVLGVFSLVITLVVVRLVKELSDLSVYLPRYVKPVQDFTAYTFERSKILYFSLPPEVTAKLKESLGSMTGALSNLAGSLAGFFINMASALPEVVLGVIVTVIAVYFFSKDRELIVRLWMNLIPSPWNERSLHVVREIAQAFLSYVRAQAFLISLTTVQAIAGLYIIGATYALTMGLLIGFFDVLPLLGPAAIIIPWVIWSIICGNVAFGVKLVIMYVVIWLVRQSLEARVVAANLGLHPLAVLAAIYLGLKLIGAAGVVMGPILLIAMQAIYKAIKKHKNPVG